MSKKKTNEEYIKELAKKNPNVEVVGQYIDSQTPILHRCKIDSYEWFARPANILYGKGCPKCAGNLTKTHEEYIAELAKKNPTVEVCEQYINANTQIMHHCLVHDVLWKTTPSRAIGGVGCPECKKERFRENRLKSQQEYVDEVAAIAPHIDVVGKYINATTPIEHYCKKHDIFWDASPDSILHRHGCIECGKEKLQYQLRKDHDEYVREVAIINPNIEVIEQYKGSQIPILHSCKIDGYQWHARPLNILNGKGCPKCGGHLILTNEEYINRVNKINPNIKPLEDYINARTSILHMCLIDGYIWKVCPYSIQQGYGCPMCAGNIKKTHKQYVEEVAIVNPNIEVVGQYIDAKTPMLHRCKIDGCEWCAAPTNILSGYGCPVCQESSGERMVRIWLEKHTILYIFQKRFDNCKDTQTLPFDFYLPEYNLCIEYDGAQHFQPVDFAGKGKEWAERQLATTQKHDNIKNQYCKDNNIGLIRIPYFKNVQEELEKFFIH